MKKLNLLALAAAGMLFSACSDSTGTVAEGGGSLTNGSGDGYISLSINLPTTPTTRALNDDYDDGQAYEYEVRDAGLLLFTGTSEASARLMYAQSLDLPIYDKDADGDNITTAYHAVTEVSGSIGDDENLYGLVVLNYKNVLTIDDNLGTAKINTEEEEGQDVTINYLSDLQSKTPSSGNSLFTTKKGESFPSYFFMTNAILQAVATNENGNKPAPTPDQIQTLARLDKSKIYSTEAEAKANPAGNIYVERAVAKATLEIGDNATEIGTGKNAINIESVEWAIDNIEPTSYIVRNPGDNDYIAYSSGAFTNPVYRFVGDAKMGNTTLLHPDDADLYRHYWAIDPQYTSKEDTRNNYEPADSYYETGDENPQYCNENTFNVANQTYGNTTRAIIKVTANGGETFYTINGSEKIYSEADAKSYIVKALIENQSFQDKIEDCLLDGKKHEITSEDVVAEWGVSAAKQLTLKSITLNNTKFSADDFDLDELNNLTFANEVEAANGGIEILEYTNGVVYYEARFEHFANTAFEKGTPDVANAVTNGDLAPWNFWEEEKGVKKPDAGNSYPGNAEQNYLGRYGMVRNNWYDVTVTAFKKLGSPVDPTGSVAYPDTPDDDINAYISVKINVLSWAKRTQSWEF